MDTIYKKKLKISQLTYLKLSNRYFKLLVHAETTNDRQIKLYIILSLRRCTFIHIYNTKILYYMGKNNDQSFQTHEWQSWKPCLKYEGKCWSRRAVKNVIVLAQTGLQNWSKRVLQPIYLRVTVFIGTWSIVEARIFSHHYKVPF